MNRWLDSKRELIRTLLFITLGLFLVLSLVLGIIGIVEVFRVSNTFSDFEMTLDESGDFNPEAIDIGPSKLGQASSVLGILLLVTLAAILVLFMAYKVTNVGVVFVKKPRVKTPARSSTPDDAVPEETISCPNCGSSNELEATFCTYCGEKVN